MCNTAFQVVLFLAGLFCFIGITNVPLLSVITKVEIESYLQPFNARYVCFSVDTRHGMYLLFENRCVKQNIVRTRKMFRFVYQPKIIFFY